MFNTTYNSQPGSLALTRTWRSAWLSIPLGLLLGATTLMGTATANAAPGASVNATVTNEVSCGATLSAGKHELEADLFCDPGLGLAVLTLTSDSQLDLNGKTVMCANGADGVGILVMGTGAEVKDGTVVGCGTGIRLDGGGNHRLTKLQVFSSWGPGAGGIGTGIVLAASHDNRITDSTAAYNQHFGVNLIGSERNRLSRLDVHDNMGPSHSGGFLLFGSHDNILTANTITNNADAGIQIHNSSRNTVRRNTVLDSNFFGRPTTNILLLGDSDENLIRANVASSSVPGAALDGINVGCKDGGCTVTPQSDGFPSTGADNNRIEANTTTDNQRFGIAQAAGNVGNVYERNTATGNGVADFAID